ncbi:hypothetical protein ACHAPT_013515 [Fusarium lateritium]
MQSFTDTYLGARVSGGETAIKLDTYAVETRHFIDGQFVPSKSGKTFVLTNPATGELSANVSEAQAEDVELAVEAASRASKPWSKLPGKAHDVMGLTSLTTDSHLNLALKQPYGVTAAIIPWNVSLIMMSMKIGPSLIAGNTLVLKSSEKSPLTSLLFARLAKRAGMPAGVLNVVSGFGKPCGDHLARHMKIRKISFTGSVPTGKLVQKAAAESNLKDCTLELGGKSPLIILEDADLEKAAHAAAVSIMFNSGQICMASTRVLYKDKIIQVRGKVGDPRDTTTTSGPVADRHQFHTIKHFLERAKQQSCSFDMGGIPVEGKGCFVEPVIIWDPPKDSDIVKEEVFGPVVCVIPFDDQAEALSQANDSEYGLYASVFTRDLGNAVRIAKEFEAGTVAINTTSPYH